MLLQNPVNPPFCWRRKKCDSPDLEFKYLSIQDPGQEGKFYFTAALHEHDMANKTIRHASSWKPSICQPLRICLDRSFGWYALHAATLISEHPNPHCIFHEARIPSIPSSHASSVYWMSSSLIFQATQHPLGWARWQGKYKGRWHRVGALASQECLSGGGAFLLAQMERDVSD